MTTYTIGLGESIVIPARAVEEHLHALRRTRGLAATNHIKNGTKVKILRAYTRPRDQASITIKVSETEVKVTARVLDKGGKDITEPGRAVVDIIDEISEPWGDDHDIYVVREPQLKAAAPESPEEKEPEEAMPVAPVAVKVTAPAPLEVKADQH
jgi:hypothetical protein